MLTSPTEKPRSTPLVSIGLPVYNGARYLKSTLNALLSQDYTNLEILISDNASTDSTAQIAQDYSRAYPMITYSRNEKNIGAAGNFSSVFTRARGKYFMWASDHDLWSPSLISRGVQIMEQDTRVVLCFGKGSWLAADDSSIPIREPVLDSRSVALNPLNRFLLTIWGLVSGYQTRGLFRTDALKRALPVKKMFGSDLVFLCELSCLGAWAEIPGETFYSRQLTRESDFYSQFMRPDLDLSSSSPEAWYWQFVGAHLKLVWKYFPGLADRASLALGVLHCMWTKYRWIPSVIRQALAKQNNLCSTEQSCQVPAKT